MLWNKCHLEKWLSKIFLQKTEQKQTNKKKKKISKQQTVDRFIFFKSRILCPRTILIKSFCLPGICKTFFDNWNVSSCAITSYWLQRIKKCVLWDKVFTEGFLQENVFTDLNSIKGRVIPNSL